MTKRKRPKSYSGKYTIKNPSKYKGDWRGIIYRSLKERSIMYYLDHCDEVIHWSSEETVVPYIWEVDGKPHRYFIDFYVKMKDKNGEIKEYLLEYKPHVQTLPPKEPKRKTARWAEDVKTYIKNLNKWEAAKKFASKKGMEFFVISEQDVESMRFFKDRI